jgi:large subunit ribosomal protein L4
MAVKSYLSNQRQGTRAPDPRRGKRRRRSVETKGTGRARQGSIRSPQWTHGGIVFAPKPRDYTLNITKNSEGGSQIGPEREGGREDIIVVDNIALDEIKTKAVAKMLEAFRSIQRP